MIGKLTGRLDKATETIDVGQVGYSVKYAGNHDDGDNATFIIETIVRETEFTLWAFDSVADRDAFRGLMKIQKVGPSVAGAVITKIGASGAYSGDVDLLATVPRVGKKMAENIVAGIKVPEGFASNGAFTERKTVTNSLSALGYSAADISRGFDNADISPDASIADAIQLVIAAIND